MVLLEDIIFKSQCLIVQKIVQPVLQIFFLLFFNDLHGHHRRRARPGFVSVPPYRRCISLQRFEKVKILLLLVKLGNYWHLTRRERGGLNRIADDSA